MKTDAKLNAQRTVGCTCTSCLTGMTNAGRIRCKYIASADQEAHDSPIKQTSEALERRTALRRYFKRYAPNGNHYR